MRILYSFIIILVFSFSHALTAHVPTAFADVPEEDITAIKLSTLKSGHLSFTLDQQIITLPKGIHKTDAAKTTHSFHTTFQNGELNATWGGNGLFGQLHLNNKTYIITTEKEGMWAVKMPESAHFNSCGTDHDEQANQWLNQKTLNHTAQHKTTGTVIDLLVVYDQAIADRYPGALLEARVQQYIHVANQSYVNSQMDLSHRLVGLKQSGYNANNANQTLLHQIQETLEGTTSYQGLSDIPAWRAETGADLVIFLRTHDILTRGNCGIAFFPVSNGQQYDSSYGINIMSDGSSSWSICTDQLMVHEIGHNLGAGHHNAPPQSRFLPDAAGFAKLGQYGTIMGSFGTGNPNRFLELNYFSNPNIQCGGDDCGIQGQRNNVNVMSQLKGPVSLYLPNISNAPHPSPLSPSLADNDGDQVINQNDAFPFDASEVIDSDGDGFGDNQDVFPNNAAEWADYDADGLGNNADNDDDNDGVPDSSDQFPLNASEVIDSDSDGVGNNSDDFINNPSEITDSDLDGVGDNEDSDSDDDGYPDIDSLQEDVLVISVNNNRILRFDAQTGQSKGIEVLPADGFLTFQSDLVYDHHSQRLIYTTESRIKALPARDREQMSTTLIYPYSDDKTQLNSGFPSALAWLPDQKLRVAKTRTTNNTQVQHDYMAEFSVPLAGQANFSGLRYIPEQDETLIDFFESNNTLYALGANNRLYKGGVNDTQLQSFGPSSSFWLEDAYAILVTDAGKLIHTKNSQLLQTDAVTGATEGVFASTFQLGYEQLTGVTQTQDNRILVADVEKNALLQFNSEGEFLGELVSGNGMDGPHKILAVPALEDRFYQNPDRVISPNAGNWFNPERSGHGFNVGIFNDRLQVLWFTYDQNGLPVWYFSAGPLDGFNYQGDLLKTTQISDTEVDFELVGALNVDFSNERQATIDWQLGALNGIEQIQWQQFSFEPEQQNYTGMWTRDDAPGWGTAVTTIGEKTVITPFIYDVNGEPRWLSSDVALGSSPLQFNLGFFTSTSLCPGCSGEPEVTIEPVGNMSFDFETNTWQSDINWPSPLSGSWQLTNTEIIRISDEPIRPR